ncbi:MAG: hypothetical protein NXI04_23395 [Planctomycetaceae bacterium]|nr:hypothetical protein [Planctomycetaceae bacterium]
MLRFLAITLASLPLCGCQRKPAPIVWTPHTLSAAEEERQEQLLEEIHGPLNSGLGDSLEGTLASDHSELLSLADTTGVRGTEQFYKFNVLSEGDLHDPVEMIFIIEHKRIKFARWPSCEF